MVVLISKFAKLYSKMGDHPNSPSDALPSAAQAFEDHVCHRLLTLFSPTTLSTGNVSLSWLWSCLEMLPYVNRAFARLVASIDHPIGAWGPDSAEDYLSYTLNLLEHLNRMSAEISRLGQARVSLAHALSVSESAPLGSVRRLKGIAAHASWKDCGKVCGSGVNYRGTTRAGKDWAIRKALNIMKGVEFWVSGIVISALSGDTSPYLEMRSVAVGFLGPSVVDLEKKLHGRIVEKGIFLEEVMEINDSVDFMARNEDGKRRSVEAQVLHSRLDGIEKLTEGLRKEVDCVFSEVMASRNALLDCLRAVPLSDVKTKMLFLEITVHGLLEVL